MGLGFNADEVLQMAERIERNGADFYRYSASRAERPETRDLFLTLAEREEEHERTFAGMRAQLSERERKAEVYDPENQATAYLQAWADGQVFDVRSNLKSRLAGKETLPQILEMAMGAEKDSIVFYTGMKDAVPERMGRGWIEEIIREEMRHLSILNRELTTLRHQAI